MSDPSLIPGEIGDIPPIVPVPLGRKGPQPTGTDVTAAAGRAVDASAGGQRVAGSPQSVPSGGGRGRIGAPQATALPAPQTAALNAPQQRLAPPDIEVKTPQLSAPQVEQDIGRTIDAQDGPIREVPEGRGGKPAVEFELNGDKMWVNEDGIIGNDTTRVVVRDQGVLDQVRTFLEQLGSRFAKLARIF